MILLCYKSADSHTFTDKNMAACFSRVPCMRPSPGTWDASDSECFQFASSHRFWNKNYGLSMWRPRPRYEWRFVKHQRTDDLPQSVLTVDSHCQSTCKVRVQSSVSLSFHAVQNFLLPDIWFVRLRRIFGCQNLHCHLVKPHIFAVSRTDFLSYLQPNQCCYPECHLRKGAQREYCFCKERSVKFSTRFSSSSFANANGAVCQKMSEASSQDKSLAC